MKIKYAIIIVLFILISFSLNSCALFEWALWKDIDTDDYKAMPSLSCETGILPYLTKVISSRPNAYSEIRIGNDKRITFGEFQENCHSKKCQQDYLASMDTTSDGFSAILALPLILDVKSVYIKNEKVASPKTMEKFTSIYKPFDSREKAAALLAINNYYWDFDEFPGLIKSIEDGFEAIVISGTYCGGYNYCHVKINYSGEIIILREKMATMSKGCIH